MTLREAELEALRKPALPMVLGTGPLADAMRAQIAADPDRYRPMSMGLRPVGRCPCCSQNVYRVSSRVTGFVEAFATGIEDTATVHPRFNAQGEADPSGTIAGCCCKAPNWGPKHHDGSYDEHGRKKPTTKKSGGAR